MTSDEVRQLFLNFFQDRSHRIIPGTSLIPRGDPTLLLTTAGVVQIIPYFLGLEKPPSLRLASCQKCFRTTDIDSVGDMKHLTFFEMLGNFSVGEYFKKEAISWAWEFVTKYLKLSPERLWVTIYLDDDEAFAYWRQVGIPAERILRFGDEDNFWGPAGDSGPCGPCSEIHYDLGEEVGCGRPECKPNCECGRFSEIWNLVFTQYDQKPDGSRTPLARPNIDTGMGVERTAAAVQGKSSVYQTDLFEPIVEAICELSDKSYGASEESDRAIRVIAEHSRGIPFLIADGVLPSNEARGYVLRRVLRRASLFGQRLGLDKPFVGKIAQTAIDEMGHVYPELIANRGLIREVIRAEEEKFITTLGIGLGLVEELVEEALSQGKEWLPGDQVFRLYDTYGFPKELTAEIARERGLSVDLDGFEAEMEKQRERARAAQRFVTASDRVTMNEGISSLERKYGPTEFIGYESTASQSRLLDLKVKGRSSLAASRGDELDIILARTPFYGEMGGQLGDTGEIVGHNGKVAITNTIRTPSDVIIHRGKVIEGSISVSDQVEAKIDVARRLDIARNHTATHLVQAALRNIFGSHVSQRGSLVEPTRLRFDFSHMAPITQEQLGEIQRWVNGKVRQDLSVKARFVPYKQAVAEGAIALFEEKYGETVRVLEIGEPAISKELCGGTHVKSTGEIGFFLITAESSIGTGLRRLEAVTGRGAECLVEQRLSALQDVSSKTGGSPEEAPDKVRSLARELELERKHSLSLETELSREMAEALLEQTETVDGVTVLVAKVSSLSMPILRDMGDILRDRLGSGIVVLATIRSGKPKFLAMVTPDLVAKGFHAGDIIKRVAEAAGGGGGGNAKMAQAGGRDAAKVDEALNLVKSVIASKAKQSDQV